MTGSASSLKLSMKDAYEFCRFFGPNLKFLTLKLTEKTTQFSEVNVLLCHMTGSAPFDPKLKIFVENTVIYQSIKF